jgi:hypothetical protein
VPSRPRPTGEERSDDGDAKRHQQTPRAQVAGELQHPRSGRGAQRTTVTTKSAPEHGTADAPRSPRAHPRSGRGAQRRRRAKPDSMRPAPHSSAARNARHKVPRRSVAASPTRERRTADGTRAAGAANSSETRSGQRARQRELLRVGATPPVCSGLSLGARLPPGMRRSAGRPSVWVSASAADGVASCWGV